jgi:hypothetical protein
MLLRGLCRWAEDRFLLEETVGTRAEVAILNGDDCLEVGRLIVDEYRLCCCRNRPPRFRAGSSDKPEGQYTIR